MSTDDIQRPLPKRIKEIVDAMAKYYPTSTVTRGKHLSLINHKKIIKKMRGKQRI